MLVRKINKRRCKVSFCSHSDPSFVLKNNVLSLLHCIPDLWISTPKFVGQNLFVVPKCVSLPFIFMVGGYHYNLHN